MQVGRQALGDGQPPAYVFTSPCCGTRSLLPAWIVEYAVARTGGRLLLECGRPGSDPLRTAGAVPGAGCGQRYVVDITPDTTRARRPPPAAAPTN